jgi:hypothetical protein
VLSVALACESDTPRPQTLAGQINAAVGIQPRYHRLLLGDMDILMDPDEHVRSLQIRTNPRRWVSERLPHLVKPLEAVSLRFLVNYDTNGVASYPVTIQITRDPAQADLRFTFGDYKSSRWFAIADGLVVGTTVDQYLSEIRVGGSIVREVQY